MGNTFDTNDGDKADTGSKGQDDRRKDDRRQNSETYTGPERRKHKRRDA